MSLLSPSEALVVSDSFLRSLYGDEIFTRWKELKDEMRFCSERDYVTWLIDVALQQDCRKRDEVFGDHQQSHSDDNNVVHFTNDDKEGEEITGQLNEDGAARTVVCQTTATDSPVTQVTNVNSLAFHIKEEPESMDDVALTNTDESKTTTFFNSAASTSQDNGIFEDNILVNRVDGAQMCKVCGAKAAGKNYGVISCIACRSFFYRTCKKGIAGKFLCRLEKKCRIDYTSWSVKAQDCQYCRFQKCLALGMSLAVPCKVCGDKSSSVHYGVISCDDCATFFQVSKSGGVESECLADNNCVVIAETKAQCCRHCYFQKCLGVGMYDDAFETGVMCEVCGVKACGSYYGVNTCNGCRIFFLRSTATPSAAARYSCRGGGGGERRCTVDRRRQEVMTVRQCSYCRLQKCRALGMRRGGAGGVGAAHAQNRWNR